MRVASLVVLSALVLTTTPASATAPSGFDEQSWTLPVGAATGMAFAPDGSGRLFVTHKTGTVQVARIVDGAPVLDGANVALTTFLTETVITNSECGIIGIAFDPGYLANHWVYIFATKSNSEQQIIRFTDDGTVGGERKVIISGLPTRGQNHDGGGLGFGTDGKLYWAVGDNGNGVGVDNDLASLASKVGRANRDGTPVNDNPFFDGVGPNNEYIWARGFRNPFTMTFDPASGELWVNTVGTSYEQIFVPRRGDHAGYNDFENNQPVGYITPVVKFRTNGSDERTVANATRTGGVARYTTTSAHRFRLGERITVSGVAGGGLNGVGYVSAIPSDVSFEMALAGADGAGTGGSAQTDELSGSITGGTFYDATLYPDDYRGDFIFGDYNYNNLIRVQRTGGVVAQVDEWATNISSSVDVALGPDGALWGVGVTSQRLRRWVPTTVGSKLVVSGLHPWVPEGGRATFTVSLSSQPAGTVQVAVARTAGDPELSTTISTLTFTTSNWKTPQVVTLAAALDADSDIERATFTVSASGYASELVEARTLEDDNLKLVVSTANVAVDEGEDASFTVALSRAPAAAVTVTVTRSAGAEEVRVTSPPLIFTPANFATPQTVSITADDDDDVDQDIAELTVSAPEIDTRTVTVTVTDKDASAPTIISQPTTLTAYVGNTWRYPVVATGNPTPTLTLGGAVADMAMDNDGVITWTPQSPMPANINIVADNGVAPAATQSLQLVAIADSGPTAVLTRPRDNEVVTGTTNEFFGDCQDDVGCTHAEFYVDRQLVWTDTVEGNHYHVNGEHNLWDVSALSRGPHTVTLKVFDTNGHSAEASAQVCVGECFPVTEPEDIIEVVEVVDAAEPTEEAVVETSGDVSSGTDADASATTATTDASTDAEADSGASAEAEVIASGGSDDGCRGGSGAMGWLLSLLAVALTRRGNQARA